MSPITQEQQAKMSPADALKLLKEGNERFIQDRISHKEPMEQVHASAKGQFPLGVVLTCIDSRTPPEIIFDRGIGDIFTARVAGNFINDDILGSMEFACAEAKSKVVLVMGHTSCGAVKGACDDVKLGKLTGMLANIKPAVDAVQTDGDRNSQNAEFLQAVSDENVRRAVEAIRERSDVLREMEQQGKIMIVGAMYDISNGSVDFREMSA